MIPQIKKVLYATDLTKNSSYAAYFAADMARKHDAKVVIFHCIAPIHPAIYYEIGIPDEDGVLETLREREKGEAVAEIRKRLPDSTRRWSPRLVLRTLAPSPISPSWWVIPWKRS